MLARSSHQLTAAAAYPSALTALRSVGLLDVLHNFGDRRHKRMLLDNKRTKIVEDI
jgi:hypothetical protein